MPNEGNKTEHKAKKPGVYIRTFGCQMNARDSEVVCGLLTKAGFGVVDNEEMADVIIFNTCSVRQHAEDKVWSEIGRVLKNAERKTKKSKKKSAGVRHLQAETVQAVSDPPAPDVRAGTIGKPVIGVIGCMAQNYSADIFKRAPGVDFVVGPSDIQKIPDIVKQLVTKDEGRRTKDENTQYAERGTLYEMKIWETDGLVRPEEIYHTGFHEDKKHAYVVISEGCSNYCSYCVVPYVRGQLHNRGHNDILKEIKEATEKGITSVTLLGQSVNAYVSPETGSGRAGAEIGFSRLLEMVNGIEGLKEFSFITSHPKDTSAGLFKVMATCEKLKKLLHLPVQSGSDRILKLMNRGYTRRQYIDLIEEYRKIVSHGMISTDIIVGFPREAEEDFTETFDLMKKIKFNSAYIFKYSPRLRTEAERFADDVPQKEKEKRHRILLDYQKALSGVRR